LLFTYCIHLETVPLFHSMSSYRENKLFIFKNINALHNGVIQ